MDNVKGRRRRTRRDVSVGALAVIAAAGVAALQFTPLLAASGTGPFSFISSPIHALQVTASRNAFGTSQGVKLRMALPNDSLEFPLEVDGDPGTVSYRWVHLEGSGGTGETIGERVPLTGAMVVAPSKPGMYRIAISRGSEEQILAEPTLAVAIPFDEKVGTVLNGYKIGTYLAEKLRSHADQHPDGFVEVTQAMVDLPVSRHLKLGDFITHDTQGDVWPKYVAIDPRLLDKLELVLQRLAEWRGEDSLPTMALDVHSGYRTPAWNAQVPRSARDSRHQYGDAADIAIDADRDGRITLKDEALVAVAVEQVEEQHPELVGGLGLYTSRRYPTPYVHIDARGVRSRWKG